ncbi:transcription elongation factor GreA [Patescibacteria group bacterium]
MKQEATIVTPAGLKKYEDELEDLKKNKRKEIAQRIKEAKEQGDLSENAEYATAKEEQAQMESRIGELESILKNVEVVSADGEGGKVASIGKTIVIRAADGKEDTYMLVGANEADPGGGKISIDSPLGSGFLGHEAGETVSIEIPSGTVQYTIVEIK